MPLAQSASKLSPPLLPPPSSDKKQRKHGALARTRNAESNNSTQLQRLCDETRAQYELLLERQETNHERQLHAAQSKLQDVLCSHISLIEHEKILFAEAERFRSEREQLDAAHARELAQLDTKWRSEWETRETALLARCEEEKHLVLDMIPPLELERNDAHRLLKEQEIDQLTWSKALDEANRARERAEVRLREACKHILTLKTCVKRLEQRPDTSAQERERAMALNNKWQQSKFELATVKGELASRITAVEKDFAHAHEALADEKARASDLQRQVHDLQSQCRELETTVTELRVKEQLASESRNAERAQFAKELAAVQQALVSRRAKLKDARDRNASLEQRVLNASVQNQELATKLELVTQRQRARESKWRQQKAALQTRVAHLASAARQLQLQQQERAHDVQVSRLLFGADADEDAGDGV